MFAMACIDMQQKIAADKRAKAESSKQTTQTEPQAMTSFYHKAAFRVEDEKASHVLDAVKEEEEEEKSSVDSDIIGSDDAPAPRVRRVNFTDTASESELEPSGSTGDSTHSSRVESHMSVTVDDTQEKKNCIVQ